ncbi:MAG: hypothetical protein IKK79_07345 [Spirochaetaceae bacterium]|nr:hypothetical protein [Spirochaetaceae bacterium]
MVCVSILSMLLARISCDKTGTREKYYRCGMMKSLHERLALPRAQFHCRGIGMVCQWEN